ncbi:hypothetical protein RHP47_11390 [Thermosynechococcus sp. QKsg1]|uniref:hypothetical protein n=1 Tax=unclassified Thermosynechococcus TaxID=2622553 RepID=UPI002672980B|nr:MULTISPECIES: hypothetical protein [unclassified Thermosynechococcus]WKT83433.1 hypothetical protein QYC28_11545 [Thermosynechococcus sp. HY596]WNC62564.1 hypothetical protein RHK13_11540 [Thermosynechococcus sp. HY591]WNC65120.1 hypothetical protein RHK28_11580 [Thermosynechococcus sp. HY593]WNC86430.1 hypothetical protein RHP47_11390 [Thermosynechococcus sp. QKsg1]
MGVAAFDGENADPLNGRQLAPGILARTPWGEIAWALAGQEGNDAFVILAYVCQLPETKTTVSWQGNCQTVAGSHLEFEYEGNLNDLGPVKDFWAAQMRAASEKELHATYAIEFFKGLELAGNTPEQVTERLCRQGVGQPMCRQVPQLRPRRNSRRVYEQTASSCNQYRYKPMSRLKR